MNDIKKLLGNRIKSIRKARNLTQEKLAEIVGIGTPNISYIECGKFAPSIDTFKKIADALNVEPYELYRFDSKKTPDEMISELIQAVKNDEKLLDLIYKFYNTIRFNI